MEAILRSAASATWLVITTSALPSRAVSQSGDPSAGRTDASRGLPTPPKKHLKPATIYCGTVAIPCRRDDDLIPQLTGGFLGAVSEKGAEERGLFSFLAWRRVRLSKGEGRPVRHVPERQSTRTLTNQAPHWQPASGGHEQSDRAPASYFIECCVMLTIGRVKRYTLFDHRIRGACCGRIEQVCRP